MSDRRETGEPEVKIEENCVRCGQKIDNLRIDVGRGIYRWVTVEPGTRKEHQCKNTRVRG